jgi:hypothetical protein
MILTITRSNLKVERRDMKEQAKRPKKRASKRAKDHSQANPERVENAGRISLRLHPNLMREQKMDVADWAEIEELWRGI